MLRTTAFVFAVLVAAGAPGAAPMAQVNAQRPETAQDPKFSDPGVRVPIAMASTRRGTDAWAPVVRLAPPIMRSAATTTARIATRPHAMFPVASPWWVDPRSPRTLSLFNVHTHETISVTYLRDGNYVQSELARLKPFLRDSRNESEIAIDPALLDILWEVRQRLASTESYHVLSGYRSPSTNAWLASVSSGVARDSLHMRGQAIDVMLPGRTAAQISAVGHELNRGGVGFYPRSGFVHLDTGPVRYW